MFANIYACAISSSGDNLFVSSNNGNSWSLLNNGLHASFVSSLLFKGSTFFASSDYGLYTSSNNGADWLANNNGIPAGGVGPLCFNGTNLFAPTSNGEFISSNNGASWSSINTGLPNQQIMSVVSDGTTIFSGTNGAGVYITNNNDSVWHSINTGFTTIIDIRALAIVGGTIYAGTNSGVWKRSIQEILNISKITKNNTISISPNPTNATLTFLNSNLNNSTAEILSLEGKIVKVCNITNNAINVKDLPQGMYLLRIIAEKEVLQGRFVKN